MKEYLMKASKICKLLFGYGIMFVLFAGGLTFFGYLAALFVGGSAAEAICIFIYKKIIPVIVYTANCLVIFGLISMYLAGELALTTNKKKK